MSTPTFPTRDGQDFVGYTHQRVIGPTVDLVAVDPSRGADRFWNHFRGEGLRHADLMTREFLTAAANGINLGATSPLCDIGSLPRPIGAKQQAYAEGVTAGFDHHIRQLLAIPQLRTLGLGSSYITASDAAIQPASGLTNEQCHQIAALLSRLGEQVTAEITAGTTPAFWASEGLDALRQYSRSSTQQSSRSTLGAADTRTGRPSTGPDHAVLTPPTELDQQPDQQPGRDDPDME
jgi:hypothetical protein